MSSAFPFYAFLLLFCVCIGGTSSMVSAVQPIEQYENCKYLDTHPGERFKVYWTLTTNNQIRMALWAETPGWMAIGFNDAGDMHGNFNGTDILVGWATETGQCSEGCLQDYFSASHQTPYRDDHVDATDLSIRRLQLDTRVSEGRVDNVVLYHGQQRDGITVVEFQRPLQTGDPFDYDIDPLKEVHLIYALNRYNDPADLDGLRLPKHHITGSVPVVFSQSSQCAPVVVVVDPSTTNETETPPLSYHSPDGNFYVEWTFSADQSEIEFRMIGKTNGWVALGLNDNSRPSMPHSDIYVGWVSSSGNHVVISDRYAAYRGMPLPDDAQGGSSDAILHAGKEIQGYTEIIWTRPVVSADRKDVSIRDETMNLLWAIGPDDGDDETMAIHAHTHTGSVQINLFTGQVDDTLDRLRRIHGGLMVFGFCVLFGLSAFVAAFTDVKSGRHGLRCGAYWIKAHILLNVIALALILSSFFIILHVAGSDKLFLTPHGLIGLSVILALFTIQPLFGTIAHLLYRWRARQSLKHSPSVQDTAEAQLRPQLSDSSTDLSVSDPSSPSSSSPSSSGGMRSWLRFTMLFHVLHRYFGRIMLMFAALAISLGLAHYGSNYNHTPSRYYHVFYAYLILILTSFLLKRGMIMYDKKNGTLERMYAGILKSPHQSPPCSPTGAGQRRSGSESLEISSDWKNHMAKVGVSGLPNASADDAKADSETDDTVTDPQNSFSSPAAKILIHVPHIFLLAALVVAIVLAAMLFQKADPSQQSLDPTRLNEFVCGTDCQIKIKTMVNYNVSSSLLGLLESSENPLNNHQSVSICNNWWFSVEIPYHLVRFESIVRNPRAIGHIALYLWPSPPDHSEATNWECTDLPSNAVRIYYWANGMDPYEFPPEAGFPIGGEPSSRRLVMQVRYDLSQLEESEQIIDNSGLKLFATRTLRPYNASVLRLGVAPELIDIPGSTVDYELPRGVCSSLSTQEFQIPAKGDHITILNYGFQMNDIGTRAITELYRRGEKVGTLAAESAYDSNTRKVYPLPSAQIYKGDELYTTCYYDSQDRDAPTRGGVETSQETCWNDLIYYPKLEDDQAFCMN